MKEFSFVRSFSIHLLHSIHPLSCFNLPHLYHLSFSIRWDTRICAVLAKSFAFLSMALFLLFCTLAIRMNMYAFQYPEPKKKKKKKRKENKSSAKNTACKHEASVHAPDAASTNSSNGFRCIRSSFVVH